MLFIFNISKKKCIRSEAASKFRIPGTQDFITSSNTSINECKSRRQIRTIRNFFLFYGNSLKTIEFMDSIGFYMVW